MFLLPPNLSPEAATQWLVQPIVIAWLICLLLATIYKVRELRLELQASEERLERSLDELKAELKASEAEMREQLHALKAELKDEIKALEKKLTYVLERLQTLETAADQGASQCPPHGRHLGWRRLGWRR